MYAGPSSRANIAGGSSGRGERALPLPGLSWMETKGAEALRGSAQPGESFMCCLLAPLQ